MTGHIVDPPLRKEREVIATVKAPGIQKGARIVFTIKNYKAPKIAADADEPNHGKCGVEEGWTITVQSSIPATCR